jgi:hypothetical protein
MENALIDRSQLRKFGLILSSALVLIFGLLLPYLNSRMMPAWPFATAIVLLIPTFIQPLWLKTIYTPWMKLGAVMGWINTRIILGIVFFILITPMGLLMRLLGKDPMQRKLDKTKTSYRKLCDNANSNMEKPY